MPFLHLHRCGLCEQLAVVGNVLCHMWRRDSEPRPHHLDTRTSQWSGMPSITREGELQHSTLRRYVPTARPKSWIGLLRMLISITTLRTQKAE